VELGTFNLWRTLGFLLQLAGGVVWLPWLIGCFAAPEFMLKGSFLVAGLSGLATWIAGVALMRFGNWQERNRAAAKPPESA
jgi:hypothetical protein